MFQRPVNLNFKQSPAVLFPLPNLPRLFIPFGQTEEDQRLCWENFVIGSSVDKQNMYKITRILFSFTDFALFICAEPCSTLHSLSGTPLKNHCLPLKLLLRCSLKLK